MEKYPPCERVSSPLAVRRGQRKGVKSEINRYCKIRQNDQ